MNRLLWWRETHRDAYDRAHQFHGWHELITRHLCGRAVSDHGIAGKFFAYDLASRGWSPSLLDTWEIDARLLPGIEPFGTAAGVIDPAVANGLSLPAGTVVGTGGFDTSCAALGSGAAVPGVIGLVVGSWESLVAPIDAPLSGARRDRRPAGHRPARRAERPRRVRAEPERHRRGRPHPRPDSRSRSSS